MIAQARACLGARADLRISDGQRLPVVDGCADRVLVSLVLHSVSHVEAVGILREAPRVLAPGGRIVATDFGTSGLRFPRGWIIRGVSVFAELATGPHHASNALDYLRRGGLTALADEAGMSVQTSTPVAGGGISIAVLGPRS